MVYYNIWELSNEAAKYKNCADQKLWLMDLLRNSFVFKENGLMDRYYKQFDNCLQKEIPYCSSECPFRMNVLDFMDKLGRKRYNAAYKVFRDATTFPGIVAELCPEYCGEVCPRKDLGGAVQVNMLEKSCIAKAKRKDPNDYNLPKKNGNIAIIGAGASGLACALRLASKKYTVTVFEKSAEIGGQLHELMPKEQFMAEFDLQFKYEDYTLQLNTEITELSQLAQQGFEAVYIATGKDGNDFGLGNMEEPAVELEGMAVFAGGSLMGQDPIMAIADGIDLARAIEIFLMTKVIKYPEPKPASKIQTEFHGVYHIEPASATEDTLFSEEELLHEVNRCLRCQCDSCRYHCDLTDYFDKWPLKMRDDIMTSTMAADSLVHKTPAIKLTNACTQCGLCGETCPGNIQLGDMIKEAKKRLHQLDRMPGPYHQFWVRDTEFANGPYAELTRKAPGKETCTYAFFPGCHLGAADPAYVERSYNWLLSVEPDTGIMLQCCGLPVDWAGNEEEHNAEINEIRSKWEQLGKPTMVMACASCMRHFREYLPEIPLISIYEMMEQHGMEPAVKEDTVYSVFDPCSARAEDDMRDAVRALLARTGAVLEELPDAEKHGCCGYGGNIKEANPGMAKFVAEKRSKMSDRPYIAYCINCRDVFFEEGKPVKHILDLMLDIGDGDALDRLPTVTEQRCNRVILKENLLNHLWGETMEKKPELTYNLIISDEVRDKLNRLRILEEDVCYTLEAGEKYGRRTFVPDNDSYRCYRENGHITCWIEYRVKGDAYEILNAYSHRMKIELEVVFNGRKTDTDLR